jgi:hypothetical protein
MLTICKVKNVLYKLFSIVLCEHTKKWFRMIILSQSSLTSFHRVIAREANNCLVTGNLVLTIPAQNSKGAERRGSMNRSSQPLISENCFPDIEGL